MKRSVIDGIGWAALGYEAPELQGFVQKPRASGPAEPDNLEALLRSMGISTEAENQIMEEVMDRISNSETKGFRAGFRLAVQMMVECMKEPEVPEEGGGK